MSRVERALDKELTDHDEIGPAERAALRAQARAVDVAEGDGDAYAITAANDGYLRLRQAAGLTAGSPQQSDTFADLLAELAKPEPGVRDTSHS